MVAQLMAVMRKELRQAFRDRRMVAILLLVPLIQLILFGFAINLDVNHIPTAICDLDQTSISRDLARGLLAGETFVRAAETHDSEAASRLLETGQASLVVIIPVGFAQSLGRGDAGSIQLLVDGTDTIRSQTAAAAAGEYLSKRGVSMARVRIEQALASRGMVLQLPQVVVHPRILYNPHLYTRIFMVPAVAAMVLLVVTTVLTAMGIARERELGTIEQILVTPLRPVVLLVGKCLPFAFIGLVELMLLLVVGSYLFDVPLRGSLILIFVASALYLMTTLGVGIFISTISHSQQQAILGGFFFIMPAILLSGFMTPIENMPHWIQPITLLDPVRYYVEIMRSCLLKAGGFLDLLPQLIALFVFGLVILTLGALRFHKRHS
jgi:ABC-type multidrug transport system, permease component